MMVDTDSLIEAIRLCFDMEGPLPLSEPSFEGNEWAYCKQCLDDGWVSSIGAFVDRFEADLAGFTGSPHVVATVNGTTALHLALVVCGIRPGDQVLLPSLTFVATANAVSHAGAVPHFVDVEERTLGIDPQTLAEHLERRTTREDGGCFDRETGARIAAVVPMHCLGAIGDIEGLLEVAAEWGIPVIEDAAEALGSSRGGRHAGTFGRCGILSFNGNKIITTGGGGAVLTADEQLAGECRHLATTARVPDPVRFVHDRVAWNYRLPNLNAALGCAQLEQIGTRLRRRRDLHRRYAGALSGIDGVRHVPPPPECESNHWLQAIEIDVTDERERDAVVVRLHEAGILARPLWEPLHRSVMYAGAPRAALPVTERAGTRIITLPSSGGA